MDQLLWAGAKISGFVYGLWCEQQVSSHSQQQKAVVDLGRCGLCPVSLYVVSSCLFSVKRSIKSQTGSCPLTSSSAASKTKNQVMKKIMSLLMVIWSTLKNLIIMTVATIQLSLQISCRYSRLNMHTTVLLYSFYILCDTPFSPPFSLFSLKVTPCG